jgi:hypothetical protein
MEANSTSWGLFELLKFFCPSLFGAIAAVWYRRNDVDWSIKSNFDKFLYTLIGLGAVVFGCLIGLVIAQVIITYAGVTEFWYQIAIGVGSGIVSLKVLDAVVKNTDDILTIVTTGVKDILINFLNRFKG